MSLNDRIERLFALLAASALTLHTFSFLQATAQNYLL